MTAWLTASVGLVYCIIGWGHVAEGRLGLGLAFFAYALANVGLIAAEKGV